MKFLGVTILQDVEFPIFLLIFAWALQDCSATELPVIMQSEQLYVISTLFHCFWLFWPLAIIAVFRPFAILSPSANRLFVLRSSV